MGDKTKNISIGLEISKYLCLQNNMNKYTRLHDKELEGRYNKLNDNKDDLNYS